MPALPGEVEAVHAAIGNLVTHIPMLRDSDRWYWQNPTTAGDQAREAVASQIVRDVEALRAAILAALAAAYTKGADENAKWECPKCGLTMWAGHTNADGSLTCPTCDDLPAALAQREAETVERCCKAICMHCADGSPLTTDPKYPCVPMHTVPVNDMPGRTVTGSCKAWKIRALAGDGGKDKNDE